MYYQKWNCAVGTSDFYAQMSGIEILKGDEILRPVYKKNLFSLIRSNGVSKNPSFHTDFKNVHMTLVKSAPKKVLPKKPIFLGLFNW